jgi:hypothetical protein
LRFKLKATNEIGSAISDDYLQVLLASVPSAPSAEVEEVYSKKDSLVVFMPIVSQNEGSTLTEYQLWADDGLQSQLEPIYTGLNRTVQITAVQGRSYRFCYRVRNALGWSDISPISIILAAEAPEQPKLKPTLIEVSLSQIRLGLNKDVSDNGATITDFVLY